MVAALGHTSTGRPPAQWSDDIIKTVKNHWNRLAQDRKEWRAKEEAYSQQRDLGCLDLSIGKHTAVIPKHGRHLSRHLPLKMPFDIFDQRDQGEGEG